MKSWGQSKKKSAEFAAPAAGWDAPQDRLFAVLLALALLLRLWLAVRGHAIRHPDEVFQGLEQAHRMVFGYGVPTIEMARHLRWPGLAAMLAVPQYFAALLQLGPQFYIPLTRAGAAVLSLLPVPLLYLALRPRFGVTIAALACLLPMFWVELVDFATSPLADALAAPLLCAAALLPFATARRGWRWALSFCGLLALACALRLQLAVPTAVIAVPVLWQANGSERVRIIVAALLMLVALVAIDLVAGIAPFADVAANVTANMIEGLAADFGTEPWFYYPLAIAVHWGPALPVGIALLLIGFRQSWRLSLPALSLLVALSLIDHKEYRFYFPATELLVAAMGWGLAVMANGGSPPRWGRLGRGRRPPPIVAGVSPERIGFHRGAEPAGRQHRASRACSCRPDRSLWPGHHRRRQHLRDCRLHLSASQCAAGLDAERRSPLAIRQLQHGHCPQGCSHRCSVPA